MLPLNLTLRHFAMFASFKSFACPCYFFPESFRKAHSLVHSMFNMTAYAPTDADVRPSHRGTPYGRPGSVLAGAPMPLNDASAVNLPRLMQPRPDPPAHSALSPRRQYPNGGEVDTPATAVSRGSVTAAGAAAATVGVSQGGLPPVWEVTPRGQGGSTFAGSAVLAAGVRGVAVASQSTAIWPPMVQRLQKSVRRNTSFNIMANPGVQVHWSAHMHRD